MYDFLGIENKGNTICHKCPVPHIQQEMREYDEEIITNLLAKSSSFRKGSNRFTSKKLGRRIVYKSIRN